MKKFKSNNERGFTLIELLVVIVILAALSVTIFVALNPLKRIKDARDARRATDVASILTAIHVSINLSTPLNKYLKSVPVDPNGGTDATTNYTVSVDTNNIVSVKACGTEGTTNISQSR